MPFVFAARAESAERRSEQVLPVGKAKMIDTPSLAISDTEMKTIIDKMLEFVQEHGKTTVAEVADVFAMDQVQVEKLASILEESGLITMRYALLHPGRTELVSNVRKGALVKKQEKTAELQEMLKSVESEMDQSQQEILNLERDVMNRLVRVERLLDEVERAEKGANKEDMAFVVKEIEELEKVRRDISAHTLTFEKRVEQLGKRIRNLKRSVRPGILHTIVSSIKGMLPHKKTAA